MYGQSDADKREPLRDVSSLADRVKQSTGGPRHLALVLESIQVCNAVRQGLEPSSARFLASVP